jgi:hypothetical protein
MVSFILPVTLKSVKREFYFVPGPERMEFL